MTTFRSLREIVQCHTKVQTKGHGGNTKFSCNHCKKIFTGSQTRQLAHLTGTSGSGVSACQAIEDDLREALKLDVERLERTKSGSKTSSSQLSTSGSCWVTSQAMQMQIL